MLFHQILRVVQEYWDKKVQYKGKIDEREVCLEKYINLITQSQPLHPIYAPVFRHP